jgi:hypothetical protein
MHMLKLANKQTLREGGKRRAKVRFVTLKHIKNVINNALGFIHGLFSEQCHHHQQRKISNVGVIFPALETKKLNFVFKKKKNSGKIQEYDQKKAGKARSQLTVIRFRG